ncbi:MAG: hypothetical protein QME28_04295 [Candidatus Saccharicenans sp.]|nr:hypothetical protein [Candidatus Saccharicenans sp.]
MNLWLVVFSLLMCFHQPAGVLVDAGSAERMISLHFFPGVVRPGSEFRVVLVSEEKLDVDDLKVEAQGPGGGKIRLILRKSGGGPPFWSWWEGKAPVAGNYQVDVYFRKKLIFSEEFKTGERDYVKGETGVFWKAEGDWNRKMENLYSAWLEALFQEAGEKDSWPDLDSVLKKKEWNFLYNHLGQDEDRQLKLEPDCADNPFFLRGYFAWKMRLPFGFHECSRGSLARLPVPGRWFHNELPTSAGPEASRFSRLMRQVMNVVHSGTGRTALTEENSDYYPLPLAREWLRPGTVYADPYGHTLVIVRWKPQTRNRPGILLAVDAQPDGTIGLKRFWKGNFLFATEEVIGDPGFKAFRPVVRASGRLRLMSNREIQESQDYGNYSIEQLKLKPEVFYEKMDRLINPHPLDPETALKELYQALYEQLLVRVEAVENAEKYFRGHPGKIIPMPEGATVFLTTGPWEDYSTPNRDLRLLIAFDTIEEFPERVARDPEKYGISVSESPEKIKARLEKISAGLGRGLSISYRRSDGSLKTLTLEEVLSRKEAFEMAYNPNDCPEIRWGASPGSEEMSTCSRQAPSWQRERMEKLRPWFRKRLHPPT